MTQDMLADRAGLSASLVQKLEGDFRRSVRISTLSALARVLKVPVSVLLGDEPSEGSALPGGQPVKARVSGGTLRAWRRSRGWDVPDMARRLRRAAGGGQMPVHDALVRMIHRWESGRGGITERYELLYAAALEIEPDMLRNGPARQIAQEGPNSSTRSAQDFVLSTQGMAGLMPYLDELSTDSAETRERAYDRFVELLFRWSNTMKRRELLRILGWAASAVAAKPIYDGLNADDQARVAQMLETHSRVDAAIIDHIESVLWRLIRQDDALGAQATLDTVLAQRNLSRLILPECPSHLKPRLLSLFSNYSLQAGWLLYDLIDFDGANYYYEHARTTAHEAENSELGALVLCTMSHLATWRGQPRVGIDYAVAAQAWAAQAHEPRLRAYAADVAARAFALTGQQAACMRELGIAEANLTAPRNEPEQSRMYFYTHGQFAGTKSRCLLQLGDVKGAIKAGEESLASVEPSFVRNLAFTKLFLGNAYTAAQEIDEAASLIGEAAVLAAQNRSARLLESLRSARQELNPWLRSAAVRRLDEQLRACRLN